MKIGCNEELITSVFLDASTVPNPDSMLEFRGMLGVQTVRPGWWSWGRVCVGGGEGGGGYPGEGGS